jgi:hypothetical protein
MYRSEIVVVKNLLEEYRRVCDLFQMTPEKYPPFVQAQELVLREERRLDEASTQLNAEKEKRT